MLAAALQVQVAEELRFYRTDFESTNTRDVEAAHSSRSARRSMSHSPKSEDDVLVKIERSFARLAEDSGAEKHELTSYRTGFVSPVDKRERHTTKGLSRPLSCSKTAVHQKGRECRSVWKSQETTCIKQSFLPP